MLTLVYTLAMGLGIGATAMVSRRIGEHDPVGASRAAMQAIWLGAFLSVTLGVAGAVLAPQLLALMGAEPAVIATGSNFTRVMLGGNASVLMLFLLNAIFAARAMRRSPCGRCGWRTPSTSPWAPAHLRPRTVPRDGVTGRPCDDHRPEHGRVSMRSPACCVLGRCTCRRASCASSQC
jgi:hypothetical protein